jgi:hypothetical protein
MNILYYNILSYCTSLLHLADDSLYSSELISEMKIDRNKSTGYMSEEGRAQQVRRILEGRKTATARERDFSVREVVREQQGPKV